MKMRTLRQFNNLSQVFMLKKTHKNKKDSIQNTQCVYNMTVFLVSIYTMSVLGFRRNKRLQDSNTNNVDTKFKRRIGQ